MEKSKTPKKRTRKAATKKAKLAESKPLVVEGEIIPETGPGSRMAAKTKKALSLVLNHGVDPKDALILATSNPSPTPKTVSEFRKKVQKFSLQAPSMQKLAHRAVKDVLEGKETRHDAVKIFSNGKKVPYQEVIVPTPTNKLAAAAMVMDRVDPVVRRSENLNVTVDCSPVDLSKYRNR